MSVVKSKRKKGELEVLTKARDLKSYTLNICSNTDRFPKKYRWCYTYDVIKETKDLCRHISAANKNKLDKNEPGDIKRRYEHQRTALELTEILHEDIDTAYSNLRVPIATIEYWDSQVTEIEKLLENWIRSDKKRLLG